MLVLKSLSKSLGLPGIRLGFAFSPNTTLLASIRSSIPIWNLNCSRSFLEVLPKYASQIKSSFHQTMLIATFSLLIFALFHLSIRYMILRRISSFSCAFTKSCHYTSICSINRIFIKGLHISILCDYEYYRVVVGLPSENNALINSLKTIDLLFRICSPIPLSSFPFVPVRPSQTSLHYSDYVNQIVLIWPSIKFHLHAKVGPTPLSFKPTKPI